MFVKTRQLEFFVCVLIRVNDVISLVRETAKQFIRHETSTSKKQAFYTLFATVSVSCQALLKMSQANRKYEQPVNTQFPFH